jgi:tetratricopeptide (TPR) repeat protein
VLARQDTVVYRVSKWVRRNRAVACVSLALGIALLVGIAGTTAGMVKAQTAQSRAERQRQAALQAKHESDVVTSFLQNVLITSNPYRHGRERSVHELLRHAAARIETELAGMPAAEAAVRYAIAQTYAGMWQWASAAAHLRVSLRLNRQLYDRDDPRIAAVLSLLGRAYTFQRNEGAIELQREGLRIRRNAFGDTSREVAESTGNLGFALWHSNPDKARPAAAERCYRDALALYDQLGIHDDPDVARFTFSLAVMLKSLGRHGESEELFLQALDIYAKLPETQDCYRVRCLSHYAGLLNATGRTAEAERVMAEAVALAPELVAPAP